METLANCCITMTEVLRGRAISQANELAFVFLDHRGEVADQRTFATLDANARSIACALAARGLRGERIMLAFPPGLDFVAALFGCLYAGCVAVPVPHLIGNRARDRCAAIFHDCKPAAVMTVSQLEGDAEIRSAIRSASTDVGWIHVDATDPAPQEWVPPSVDPHDLALLQYTSGSTSAARGVMLTHANLIANNIMVRDAFGHDRKLRGVG